MGFLLLEQPKGTSLPGPPVVTGAIVALPGNKGRPCMYLQRLGVVVHRKDANLFSRHSGALTLARELGRAATGETNPAVSAVGMREGEACAHARPVALGPDSAPVRLDYSLAHGKAKAGVAPLLLGRLSGRTSGRGVAGCPPGCPDPHRIPIPQPGTAPSTALTLMD